MVSCLEPIPKAASVSEIPTYVSRFRDRLLKLLNRGKAKSEKTRDGFMCCRADVLDGLVACRRAGQGHESRPAGRQEEPRPRRTRVRKGPAPAAALPRHVAERPARDRRGPRQRLAARREDARRCRYDRHLQRRRQPRHPASAGAGQPHGGAGKADAARLRPGRDPLGPQSAVEDRQRNVPPLDRRIQGLRESAAPDRRAVARRRLVQAGGASDLPRTETVRRCPRTSTRRPERLLSDQPGFVPILPFPGKPGDPLWAWAWQRDGRRTRLRPDRRAQAYHLGDRRPAQGGAQRHPLDRQEGRAQRRRDLVAARRP